MLTEQDLIDAMIRLSTAFRTKDPDIYYNYVELIRMLFQYADEQDLDIADVDLSW